MCFPSMGEYMACRVGNFKRIIIVLLLSRMGVGKQQPINIFSKPKCMAWMAELKKASAKHCFMDSRSVVWPKIILRNNL